MPTCYVVTGADTPDDDHAGMLGSTARKVTSLRHAAPVRCRVLKTIVQVLSLTHQEGPVGASNDLSMWGCTMRVLTRRIGQSFTVGGVTITVRAIRGNRVRLGFDPPEGIVISRAEIIEELDTAAEQALAGMTVRSPPQAE